MGFWSGFEGLTGHRPGAFKGFSFKDILDDDLWKRHERLGGRQSRQFEETGVVPTTAWYRGRGRPEMMGPKVGAAEVGVKENLLSTNPDMYAGVNQRRFDATTLANQQRRNALWGSGPATVSAARPWPNIQAQMLSDPRQVPMQGLGSARQWGTQNPNVPGSMALDPTWAGGVRGAGLNAPVIRPELMGDKKTVREVFADPNKSDKITETITEKVPTGSAQWGNSQHPPNWMSRLAPTSLLNILNPSAWQDVAKRKWEERMKASGRWGGY